jgi:LuxR family maltose regulon positive regulatory protein
MTLLETSPDAATTNLHELGFQGHAVGSDAAARPSEAGTWGWAVVEIRSDGSWGRPQVVPAEGRPAAMAPAIANTSPVADRFEELSPTIEAHVGSAHVSNGCLQQAVMAFMRGTRGQVALPARDDCLARLAHAEALQGDLRRASRHASLTPRSSSTVIGSGDVHAQLARAWIALERANFGETRRRLDLVASRVPPPELDPWLTASRLLAEARLLVAAGEPDAATRLLAGAPELASVARASSWLSDLVTVARADALVESGEPQRALALVTPLPARAPVEASVVTAAARRSIGDVRGAQAVLVGAAVGLESAPLAWQIQAWLLESRLAEDQGKHDRARLMLDRALRLATAEQMRRPLVHDWRWLRAFVDRDPALLRSHKDFLSTCHLDKSAPSLRRNDGLATSDQFLGAPLTEREGQVLDLLAQMYSTDEIAAALYVSSNTVKTHLKGIFGKLCVNRRVEAVRRGRQLGLC